MPYFRVFEKKSGRKINRSKTQVTVFGSNFKEPPPPLVSMLQLKWCSGFKLLGIQFESNRNNLGVNFNRAWRSSEENL